MSPRGKRRVASSHEEPPYGERLATLEAEFKHLASKEDVLRTQLWFYASIVSGAAAVLSLILTAILVWSRLPAD